MVNNMTETSTSQLGINEEYSELLDPLPQQKYEELKQSIQEHGQGEEIAINEGGEIIDGYHRYRCCLELRIAPKFGVIYEFETKEHEKAFILSSREHASRKRLPKVARKLLKESNILCQLGLKMIESKLYDDAVTKCHQALKLDFMNPLAYFVLGKAYYEKNLLDQAIDNLIFVEDIAPESNLSGFAIEQIAISHAGLGNLFRAEYDFQEALNRRPKDVNLRLEFVSFLLTSCDLDKQGSLDQEIKRLEEAFDADPENDEVGYELMNAYFKNDPRRYLEKAIRILEEAAKLEIANHKIQTYLGVAHYMMGQTEKAKAEMTEALDLDPSDSIAQEAAKVLSNIELYGLIIPP